MLWERTLPMKREILRVFQIVRAEMIWERKIIPGKTNAKKIRKCSGDKKEKWWQRSESQ